MKSVDSFSVRHDAADGMLVAHLAGFLDAAQSDAFAGALLVGVAAFRNRHGMLRLLVDATQSGVQSGDMVSMMIAHNEGIITNPTDRIAIVVASSLLRMQAKRAAADSRVAVFTSIDDARGWMVA